MHNTITTQNTKIIKAKNSEVNENNSDEREACALNRTQLTDHIIYKAPN